MKTGKKGRRPCHHCGKLVINVALHIRNKHESDPMVGFSGMAQCRQCLENYAVNTDHASQCRFVVCTSEFPYFLLWIFFTYSCGSSLLNLGVLSFIVLDLFAEVS
jgi:hypothetical protein